MAPQCIRPQVKAAAMLTMSASLLLLSCSCTHTDCRPIMCYFPALVPTCRVHQLMLCSAISHCTPWCLSRGGRGGSEKWAQLAAEHRGLRMSCQDVYVQVRSTYRHILIAVASINMPVPAQACSSKVLAGTGTQTISERFKSNSTPLPKGGPNRS